MGTMDEHATKNGVASSSRKQVETGTSDLSSGFYKTVQNKPISETGIFDTERNGHSSFSVNWLQRKWATMKKDVYCIILFFARSLAATTGSTNTRNATFKIVHSALLHRESSAIWKLGIIQFNIHNLNVHKSVCK